MTSICYGWLLFRNVSNFRGLYITEMVERAFLTKELVDSATAPDSGERWIADSQIRGFGLRIWSNQNGEPTVRFGVRATNPDGKSIRRSLSFHDAIKFHYSHNENNFDFDRWEDCVPETLGDLSRTARIWARDTIKEIKQAGPTHTQIMREIESAELEHRKWVTARVGSYTLEKSSEILVNQLRNSGKSDAYCTRLDQIFHRIVPIHLKRSKTCQISTKGFASIFANPDLSEPNLQLLRPHLRRCLELSERFGAKCATRSFEISKTASSAFDSKFTENQIENWSESEQYTLLQFLLDDDEFWQQSLCLFLYLETGAPLSRLQRSKWQDCYIFENSQNPDPHRVELIKLGSRYRDQYSLTPTSQQAVEQIEWMHSKHKMQSKFLFPASQQIPLDRSITSCSSAMRKLTDKFELSQRTPRRLCADWRQTGSTWSRWHIHHQKLRIQSRPAMQE